MAKPFTSLEDRGRAFSQRLRAEHSCAPNARDVLDAEADLGTDSIGFQLTHTGKRLLFRALDLEYKAKQRAAKR